MTLSWRTWVQRSSLPALCVYEDGGYRVRHANEAFVQFAGRGLDALSGQPLVEVFPPAAALSGMLTRANDEGAARSAHISLTNADGGDEHFVCTAWPAFEPATRGLLVLQFGAPDEESNVLREVNGRLVAAGLGASERVDEGIRALDQRDALLAGLDEGVVVLDGISEQALLLNHGARSILELAHDEVDVEQRFGDLRWTDGSVVPAEAWPTRRVLNGEHFFNEEFLLVGKRRLQWVTCSGHAVRDAHGRVVLAILTLRDVTELRDLEQLREDYLALISHDLRNPLSIVRGRAQLMLRRLARDEAIGDDAQETVHEIVAAARRMDQMLEDLLESSRLESGKMTLDLAPVDIAELVRAAVRYEGLSERRPIAVDAPGSLAVRADPVQLERVLSNLLGNATKYSPPESAIRVSARADGDRVLVSVTDEGRGIPPDRQALLFQRYQRIAPDADGGDGHGLGLYSARLIVEAHGGRIWVESEPGQGSTFTFSLPREGAAAASVSGV